MDKPAAGFEKKPRDLTHMAHRQLIGWLGIMLPALVVIISRLWPAAGMPWGMLDSISEFYYTSATAVFVGSLFALAMFLITYGGYEGDYADRVLGKIAGFSALGVAFFPVEAPRQFTVLPWWRDWMGTAHYAFAVMLFLSFIAFAMWIFRRTSVTSKEEMPNEKRWRNRIFFTCGVAMILSIVWAGVALKSGQPIFLPESIALIAFAISWLVKGRVHESVATVVRKFGGMLSRH